MNYDWLQYLPDEHRAKAAADLRRHEEKVANLERTVVILHEVVKLCRLERFGRRSEKVSENQLMLLGFETSVSSAEMVQEASLPANQKKNLEPGEPKRKNKKNANHPGRTALSAHLLRVESIVVAANTTCALCQAPTEVIGYEVSEELCVKPVEYFVKVTKREKRACRTHPEGGVTTAAIPSKILAKSKLSDDVIIDTVVRKYQYHQPLYRQAKMIWEDAQVIVDRHTLDDGVMWVGELLTSLKAPMQKEIFAGKYIQADETPVGVKSSRVKGRSVRAYIFEYSVPESTVVYDFRMGRGGGGPTEFLKDYKGVLQCDGYAGYNAAQLNSQIDRAGCMAHVRRGFFKAHQINTRETEALSVVHKINELYRIEKLAREAGMDAAARLALRQEKSVSLMAELKDKIQAIQPTALPKSALGKACSYALEQWSRLEVFLQYGNVEIDNNWCENAIRPIVLGRKNWMLIGSENAGPKIAAIMSIIETCRRIQVNVRIYLKEILPQLAMFPQPDPSKLTPLAWKNSLSKPQT